jgi:hypothetical protein
MVKPLLVNKIILKQNPDTPPLPRPMHSSPLYHSKPTSISQTYPSYLASYYINVYKYIYIHRRYMQCASTLYALDTLQLMLLTAVQCS